MQHKTRIDSPPTTGNNFLQFTGKAEPLGNNHDISVSANSSLAGSAATGTIDNQFADIQVSEARFEELSTRPPSFTIVINADDEGNVRACRVANASEKAA